MPIMLFDNLIQFRLKLSLNTLGLIGLHDSIGPWYWPKTMVYSGHNLVCKRFNNLEFVRRPTFIYFERIPPSVLLLHWVQCIEVF
jgi:hypothetical protein